MLSSWFISFARWSALFLLLESLFMNIYTIEGESMSPTLANRDRILANPIPPLLNTFHRNDVVIFQLRPGTPLLIKRIVGLGGEKIEKYEGKLYVNGTLLEQEFTHRESLDDFESRIIPPDQLLVLGDNRGESLDSRTFGLIPRAAIIGLATAIIWPLNRVGKL